MEGPEPFFCERLSALDAAFLELEGHGAHMHIASLAIYGDSRWCRPDGGIDHEGLRERMLAVVEHERRLRQRVVSSPVFGHPYWTDDPHFQADYHIRHTALPKPGDRRQLRRLMGRLLSQPLWRGRPLWELWVVEGLAEGGHALILKLHHAMIDGMASAALLERMVAKRPGTGRLPEPCPAPTAAQLLRIEANHRARALVQRKAHGGASAVSSSRQHHVMRGTRNLLVSLLQPTLRTRLNPRRLSGQRKFDTLDVSFDDIYRIKCALEATVNDVALAIVAGGLRRSLLRSGVELERLRNTPFRALVPATTRSKSAEHQLGNQVGMMIADLPIELDDPVEQLRRIRAGQQLHKTESNQVAGSRFFVDLDERLGLGLLGQSFKLVGVFRPFNIIVTNVPGPREPVRVFDAPLKALYGAVPLIGGVGVGIALFSYAGTLHFGVQADLDALPDLHAFVEDLGMAHRALRDACIGVSAFQSLGVRPGGSSE